MEGYRTRDPRVATTGSEPGLVSLWKFDEGRGTVTVDSAAWRSSQRGGITRFGVLSPAVVDAAPSSSLLESLSTTAASAEHVPERPEAPAATWAISSAPVGVLVRSDDGRPIFLRVAGTDAHARRPLQAVLTQVPTGGNLSVASPVGQSSAVGADGEEQTETALRIGDAIPVGTRLVYRPEEGAHDPWLGGSVGEYGGVSAADWAAEGDPYDWFGYRVETEGGEEVSTNEAVMALSVRPSLHPARLDWPKKVGIVVKLFRESNLDHGFVCCPFFRLVSAQADTNKGSRLVLIDTKCPCLSFFFADWTRPAETVPTPVYPGHYTV